MTISNKCEDSGRKKRKIYNNILLYRISHEREAGCIWITCTNVYAYE